METMGRGGMKAYFGFIFCFIFEVYVKTCNISALPATFKTLYHESWDLEELCHFGGKDPFDITPFVREKGLIPVSPGLQTGICHKLKRDMLMGKKGGVLPYPGMQ